MSITHKYTLTIRNGSSQSVVSDAATYTANFEENFSDAVPAAGSDIISIVIDVSQIVSFYIESDRDVTLKTNDGTIPAQQFALKANQALWWNTAQLFPKPLTINISALIFENAGAAVANVKGGFLLNE